MAVTQVNYTGNGSTTNYSFTFPYLEKTDVQVRIDGTIQNTTAYSFANATTIAMDSAPANGAKIAILRNTNNDSKKGTFYAGSAIKSEDLNDNFDQILYVAQEVDNYAMTSDGTTPMTGDLVLGEDLSLVFEGATDDGYETTLSVTDPTADRTITLPNETGTVVTTGSSGVVTSAMITNKTIVAGDIADNTLTADQIAPNSINASELSDNAVDTAAIATDAVNGTKIADNSIDSEHYIDGSIDREHLAADIVDGTKIADDSINSEHYVNDSIDTAHIADSQITTPKLANDAVNGTKIADNSIDSEHYVDGSIDLAHLAANSVNSDKIVDGTIVSGDIAANAIDSDHYVDGSIDRVHLAADIVDGTKIADNAIGSEHIAANAVTTSEIADAELTTLAGMQSGTASVLASSTALTSTTAELNLLDGKSVVTSVSGSSNNDQLPTAKAVNDQILNVTNALGGFVAIANETSFPSTHPDPSSGAGTTVSISDAGGVQVNSSGVASITNGAGSGNTVTINGFPSALRGGATVGGVANANPYVVTAGTGIQVQTTSTLHTYDYHKIIINEEDANKLSGDIQDFQERYRVAASAPSSSLDDGDLWFDTQNNKMKVYNASGSSWDDVATPANFVINTISSSSGSGGGSATFNGTATRFVLSSPPTQGAQQLIVSINGVIQKPNSGSSAPSEGFAVDGNDILFSSAPPSSSDYFIITIGNAVTIGTPSNNTVTTAIIQNGAVTGEKIATNLDLADNKKIRFGTGNDLEIYHDGTENQILAASGPLHAYVGSNFEIRKGNSSSNEAILKGIPDGAVELYHNNVKKFETTSDGVKLGDGVKLNFNTKSYIWDNSSNDDTYWMNPADNTDIDVATAGKQIKLTAKGTAEAMLIATADGSVDLYHDNVKKFETTSAGVTVTGGLIKDGSNDPIVSNQPSGGNAANPGLQIKNNGTINGSWRYDGRLEIGGQDGDAEIKLDPAGHIYILNDSGKVQLGASQDLQIYHDSANNYWNASNGHSYFLANGNNIYLRGVNNEDGVVVTANGATQLYYDNSKKCETQSWGTYIHGSLHLDDGTPTTSGITIGNSNDLQIFHNATDSVIYNATGNLDLRSNGTIELQSSDTSEIMAKFIKDGAVELYHNNVKKVETQSTGFLFDGTGGDTYWLDNSDGNGLKWRYTDNVTGCYGSGDDLNLYHDGTNSWIVNKTGYLTIGAKHGENGAIINPDGAVELYYDNVKKLETTSNSVKISGHCEPSGDANGTNIGQSGNRWTNIFASNAPINTSDRNEKNTIQDCDLGLSFIEKLKPVSYKWNNEEAGTKTNYGLIAQDLLEVIEEEGKSLDDFGPIHKEEGSAYGLNYTQLISPLIKAVQELSAEVNTLKTKVAELEAK